MTGLRRAGPSFRGVLPRVVCLKCDRETSKNEAAQAPKGAIKKMTDD
jgi:hypothetical protein